ncbi:MAG TPA: hypothetical protein DCS55_10510 [Acidimicrobiaceae bacterium]|nr:hypothetical protein [Acidimicrobiaceae bacterium]
MLIVGICAGPSGRAGRIALPPVQRLGLPVIVRLGETSIFEAYNSIVDEAIGLDDLTGLVLIHDDVELRDDRLVEKVHDGFRTADVLGVIGGVGLDRSMDWAEARQTFGWAVDDRRSRDFGPPPPGGVDSVDGIFLGLSPRACRELRFDAGHFDGFHGYDADICAQAKSRGLQVGLVHIDMHHHNGGRETDLVAYGRAEERWLAKWRPGVRPVRRRRKRLPERLIRAAGRRVTRSPGRAGARGNEPGGGSPGHGRSAPPGPRA